MRKLIMAVAAAATLAAVPSVAKPPKDPQVELDKLLAGRVAGEPQHCIQQNQIRSSRVIDHTAIVYEIGSTLYVNRPEAGAESLDNWKVLVTDTHSSQLCNVDIVRLIDRGSRFESGFVNLGDFVPYKRVKSASRR